MLICTPIVATCSISSMETPLGVKMMSSARKPALRPNCTSWMDTVSNPEPRDRIRFSMEILDKALQA